MNKIESYIDSVIPKNIPKSKQQKLKEEIESHIYDRIDFYTEIGYDTDSSINKALADMGEDEATKTSIRNDFEELHHERTWWAVTVGILTVLISFISLFVEFSYDIDFNESYGMPEKIEVFPYLCSSIVTFLFVVSAIVLYKKGLRKCLLSLGVSSLISGAMFSTYLLSAVWEVLVYFLTKDTDVSLSISKDIVYYGFIVLIALLAVIYTGMCICLANKIKKNGKPKIKFSFVAIFSALYLIVCVVSINNLLPAAQYFCTYPYWFNTTYDEVSEQANNIYNLLENKTTLEQTEKIMADNGYINVDEYEKTLDKKEAKKFRYNLEQINFALTDDYEIWCNSQRENLTEIGNGFVFILRDENGYIETKGVGNAYKDIYTCDYPQIEYANISSCISTFHSYNVGAKKENVISYFEKNGIVYGEFTTYTDAGEDNYYRIICRGLYKIENQNELNLLGEYWYSDGEHIYGNAEPFNEIGNFYFEFWFENGVLKDGKLHYPEYYYDNELDSVEIRYKNYTLAD